QDPSRVRGDQHELDREAEQRSERQSLHLVRARDEECCDDDPERARDRNDRRGGKSFSRVQERVEVRRKPVQDQRRKYDVKERAHELVLGGREPGGKVGKQWRKKKRDQARDRAENESAEDARAAEEPDRRLAPLSLPHADESRDQRGVE